MLLLLLIIMCSNNKFKGAINLVDGFPKNFDLCCFGSLRHLISGYWSSIDNWSAN